jgi:hypothetical protein
MNQPYSAERVMTYLNTFLIDISIKDLEKNEVLLGRALIQVFNLLILHFFYSLNRGPTFGTYQRN